MDTLTPAARRFPLVARPRPACLPLDLRIQEVCDLAEAARRSTGTDRQAATATAWNKAALIASDCGQPDLARTWCWNHFDHYQHARPLDAQTARHALEPIVNLARLRIRDGDGTAAHHLLTQLCHAVKTRDTAAIDGRTLSFHDFFRTDHDQRITYQWLWTVLLADGTRALATAGRWSDAHALARQHNGIGKRLLDGRQIAILANLFSGDTETAGTILAASVLTEPWEHVVAACLTLLCHPDPNTAATASMVRQYVALPAAPGLRLWYARLGLTIIDLAGGVNNPTTTPAVTHLIDEALTNRDGYAARDLLAHQGIVDRLADMQRDALAAAVRAAGLNGVPASTLEARLRPATNPDPTMQTIQC